MERLYQFSRNHEQWELDEFLVAGLLITLGAFVFGLRRMSDQQREIAARMRAENEAIRISMIDPLTGLANRRNFEQYLDDGLARLNKDGRRLALLLIDLDRFKPVNDAFGHVVGDAVLVDFARRASRLVGSNGLVARLAGDEFAIVVDAADEHKVRQIAERLLSDLQAPVHAESGTEVSVGASIGIACAPRDGADRRTLLRHADAALYQVKTSGRGHYRFHLAAAQLDNAS